MGRGGVCFESIPHAYCADSSPGVIFALGPSVGSFCCPSFIYSRNGRRKEATQAVIIADSSQIENTELRLYAKLRNLFCCITLAFLNIGIPVHRYWVRGDVIDGFMDIDRDWRLVFSFLPGGIFPPEGASYGTPFPCSCSAVPHFYFRPHSLCVCQKVGT